MNSNVQIRKILSQITQTAVVKLLFAASLLFYLTGCAAKTPVNGPDKQFSEMMQGAATGAGAGAVTGLHVSAATGPGALVGAGIGAVTGAIQGMTTDSAEQSQIKFMRAIKDTQSSAYAQKVLSDHYNRRAELHPSRDIFPADLLFNADSTSLSASGWSIVKELTALNKNRLPYSRLVVAVYTKSRDKNSTYATHMSERRAREIVDAFVRFGLEPKRLSTKPAVLSEPILIDPLDRPERYNQAVELIAIDR